MGLDNKQLEILEQLYKTMYNGLYACAMAALRDRGLAEEAVQDTFRIACGKIDSLMASGNMQGWLMNTLKNVLRNKRKTRERYRRLIVRLILTGEHIETRWEDVSTEDVDALAEYENLLGKDDFKLLKMVYLESATILEAAAAFGISIEACKKRIQRAKKKLQKFLENCS